MENKLINIVTLGCSKNVVDSEHLAAQIGGSGFNIVHNSNDTSAKIVVINTCGFILDAQEESIDMILKFAQAKENGEIDHLFVMGCLAERYKDDLRKEIAEVDSYFGVNDIRQVIEAVGAAYDKELTTSRNLTTPSHYAYLKISEGCNWGCGYCAIPLIRGKHVSVPMEDLIEEARKLAESGVKELIVVAQDTTYYGLDLYEKRCLADLLRALCRVEGIEWIRLHYAYPAQFPLDVIDVIKSERKMCKYLDIPIQHISDKILTAMRRGTTRAQTIDLITKLRTEIPSIVLRTTLISGYPSESDADFEELKEFVRVSKFDRLGVFPYSAESGTYSAENLEDDVPQEVKDYRAESIMALQAEISSGNNEKYSGKNMRVIIDCKEGEFYIGRTENDSPEVDCEVIISSDKQLMIGGFYDVLITSTTDYDLYGEV